MTVVASFGLAFTLFAIFLGRQDTLIAIYLTAGFLISIGCWNVQTAYRTFALKRRFKKELPGLNKESQRSLAEPSNQTEVVSWSRVELRTKKLERR